MLIPSRTGNAWFHEFIYKKPNVEYEFIEKRLKFDCVIEDYKKNSATFDSMIVVFQSNQSK